MLHECAVALHHVCLLLVNHLVYQMSIDLWDYHCSRVAVFGVCNGLCLSLKISSDTLHSSLL